MVLPVKAATCSTNVVLPKIVKSHISKCEFWHCYKSKLKLTASYWSTNKDRKIWRNRKCQILKMATSRCHWNNSFSFYLILQNILWCSVIAVGNKHSNKINTWEKQGNNTPSTSTIVLDNKFLLISIGNFCNKEFNLFFFKVFEIRVTINYFVF